MADGWSSVKACLDAADERPAVVEDSGADIKRDR